MKTHLLTKAEIEAMAGSRWRMWEYSASHDRLTIEISSASERRYISFLLCERIEASIVGIVSAPVINQVKNELLAFQADGIYILCAEMVIQSESPTTCAIKEGVESGL